MPDGHLYEGAEEMLSLWQSHSGSFLWLDIEGEPLEAEKNWLKTLGCHPMAIEDVQRFRAPPKTETYAQHTLMLFRGIECFNADLTLQQQTIALFIGEQCLISVHQKPSHAVHFAWNNPDFLALLRSPGYLACSLMLREVGVCVDHLLAFETLLNELEDTMQDHPSDDTMRVLLAYKSRLRKLKRIFNYHERLVFNLLKHTPIKLIEEEGDIHHVLQDLYDRAERLNSLAEMYFDICGDLIEGYLSISSHLLNKTLQFLTMITTVLGPLTVIVGIYGMNFEHMPELHWRYGYYGVWLTMVALIVGFVVYFKRRRWL